MKEIIDEIQTQFQTNQHVRGCKLLAQIKEGSIVIQGKVLSYYKKLMAGEIVMRILKDKNVTCHIQNLIEV